MSTNPFDDDYQAPAPAKEPTGHITIYREMEQRSEEWYRVRLGVLTASVMKHFLTVKTLKASTAEKAKAQLWELAAQRVTNYVEPSYDGGKVARGYEAEVDACILYEKTFGRPVENCGFVTNSRYGFLLGYSPDSLVGDDGQLEAKSRDQRFQFELITQHFPHGTIPDEFVLQAQTGLLVTERKWLDFCSHSNGMNMVVIRVFPDPTVQAAIIQTAKLVDEQISELVADYYKLLPDDHIIPVERKVYEYERDDDIIASGD